MTARTVETAPEEAGPDVGVSVGDLEDARLGFLHLLRRKRMSEEFTERHLDDMLAQAAYELSRKLAQGERIERPAGWMVICAWNRTKNELEARDWRPRLVSTDSLVSEPVAEDSWEPEETFLAEDRMRKVHDAVDQLPEPQRELIERAYFEGESVREAARQMGWSAGKAQRAHEAARKRLKLMLGEREYIEEEIGLAAFLSISTAGRRAAADLPGGFEAAVHRVGHAASNGWHRATDLLRHPLGRSRPAEIAGATPQGSGRLSQLGGRLLTNPMIETAVTAAGGPGRVAEGCKILGVGAACLVVGGGAVGILATGHPHRQTAPAATVRPASRSRGGHQGGDGQAGPAVTSTPVTETPVAQEPATKRREGKSGSQHPTSAHKLSDSKTPSASSSQDKQSEEEEATEEAFGAFGRRSEAGSSESTAGETSSLAATETSSATESTTEAASTPKESAEKKAAGEQFQGALR